MDALRKMRLEIIVASELHAGILANPNTVWDWEYKSHVCEDGMFTHIAALKEARALIAAWNPPIEGNEDKR